LWLWGDEQPPKFSTDVQVVNVLATVRDKSGQIVRNLTKDDFLLEEDGRPQTIRYFSQQSDLPLTLGLLVDTSGSQRRLIGEERQASYRFLEQVLREKKDLAFVIHFDFEVELLQDLTSSRKDLERALDELETARPRQWGARGPGGPGGPRGRGRRGGTSLYDAVLLASDELMKKQPGRKAVILLSDGVDTGSKVSINEAIESAQRADTLVYAIRFYDEQAYAAPVRPGGPWGGGRRGRGYPPRRMPVQNLPDGKKVLQRLARETGGGYFEVSKKQPLDQVFRRIEEELRNQYNLGYTSDQPASAAGYRKIRVTTKQKGLVVQARDGYYAGAAASR
jgi:VWFA-related protein